jgi:gluconate 5-dehydrogenase
VLYENKEWVEYLCDRIPVKRPGRPEDLDAAVVFLAAEASRYVTGQTLLVDGGISTGATRALVQQEQPNSSTKQAEKTSPRGKKRRGR